MNDMNQSSCHRDSPLISVIIPTYERETSFVKRAINSVIHQTYRRLEIIVVDDNIYESPLSKDISECCEELKVQYIKNIHGGNACIARNIGIIAARGTLVAFLDDDDQWMPRKLEYQLAMMNDNVVMVYCNGWKIDQDNTADVKKKYRSDEDFKKIVTFSDLLEKNHIGTTSQFLIRKDSLMKIGGFDINLKARQDYDLCLRLVQIGQLVGCPEPLFIHYVHAGNQISKSSQASLQGYKALYKKYKDAYHRHSKARSKLFFCIARMEKLQRNFSMAIFYYLMGFGSSPRLWHYGILELADNRPV